MRYSIHFSPRHAFTLIELLVVIAIIGILAAISVSSIKSVRSAAYLPRAKSELRTIATAVEMWRLDNDGNYPDDKNRDLPPGLEKYLGDGHWPKAPWPGSTYDWDNWTISSEKVYQVSIRFCPASDSPPADRHFPPDSWAAGFTCDSAVYYCISGACLAHEGSSAPGYCVNCY
jgi:prepilin-type N-terminal cleavage/methylation domain-containing protein